MPVVSAEYLRQYMAPGQFTYRMRRLARGAEDKGAALVEANDLMCRLLESLGYATGVAAFLERKRWYSGGCWDGCS